MDKELSVFLVDDDPMQMQMLQDHLSKFSKFKIKTFPTGEDAMEHLAEKPDIVILDYNLDTVRKDAKEGIDILIDIKDKRPDTDVIMLSGQDKIEVAVNTMKYGAFDYVVKNESAFHRIENTIFNIIKKNKLQKEASTYKTLAIVFGIGLLLAIIGFVAADQMGYLTKNPGVTL